MRKIEYALLIAISLIVLASSSTANSVWWNSAWQYRVAINISNTQGDLTNYSTKITVVNDSSPYWSAMNSSCSDIRFVDLSNNELPYWLEDCPYSSGSSTVMFDAWVTMLYMENNTNTTIYLYFGAPSQPSHSNQGSHTLFSDNFNSGDWTTNWDNYTCTGVVSIWETSGTLGMCVDTGATPPIIWGQTRPYIISKVPMPQANVQIDFDASAQNLANLGPVIIALVDLDKTSFNISAGCLPDSAFSFKHYTLHSGCGGSLCSAYGTIDEGLTTLNSSPNLWFHQYWWHHYTFSYFGGELQEKSDSGLWDFTATSNTSLSGRYIALSTRSGDSLSMTFPTYYDNLVVTNILSDSGDVQLNISVSSIELQPNLNISDCVNITIPDNYNIINDIQMTGGYDVDSACIDIQSDNVNLNCNSHSISIEPGYGADIKISSHTNVSISNCVLANATVGLYLDNSDSNVFSNIHVSNILGSCWYFLDRGSGIYLGSSDSNNFDHVVVESVTTTCPMSGIDVINSNNNTFTNVLLYNNTPNGGLGGQVFADFYLLNSNYSNLDTIQALTSYDGEGNPYTPSIALESSNFNYLNHISQENTTVDFTSEYTISDSNVLNNSDVGAVYVGGNENTIANNIITGGITFYDNGASSHNYIYNNLFNSTANVRFNELYGTYFYDEVWNMTQQNGTPIYRGQNQTGGNYWSNPTATGYSDTCVDFNGDGFCDVPFTMTYGNCYGTPTSCEEITNQHVCENQQLCAWDAGNRTCYFNGGLYDCNTFYDELGCLGQSGCSWNISTSTDYLPLSFATTIGSVNVTITSPTNNANISYGAQPITIAFHVSGTLASYNATLNVNGTNISSMIIISNYSSSFVLPIYSTGVLNVTITAYNSSISDSNSIILNVIRTDTLMLLNSSAGWSFVKGTYTALNCVASNPEVVPKLYLDGSLAVIPYGFAPYYATPILVTCNSSNSQNYSGSSTSYLLNISAGGGTGGGPPPTYPPNPPLSNNSTNPPTNPPPTIPGFNNGITSATPLPPIVIQTDKLLIIITPGGYNVTMAKWANFQDHLYVKNLGADRVNIKFATDSRYVAFVGVNPVYLDIDPGSNVSFDIKAGGFTTEGYYQIPVDVQVNGKTEATAHMYVTITGEEPPLSIIFGNGLQQLLDFLKSKIVIPIIGLAITPFFILTIGSLYYAGINASRKRNWNIFLMLLLVTVVVTVVYPAYIIPGGV